MNPKEEKIARNNATFREANDAIEAAATAGGIPDPIPFICECAEPSCRQPIRLTLDEYSEVRANPRWFLYATGHEVPFADVLTLVAERDGYGIHEKIGRAGELAEQLDERVREP